MLSREWAGRRMCEKAKRVACMAGSRPRPDALLTLSRGMSEAVRSNRREGLREPLARRGGGGAGRGRGSSVVLPSRVVQSTVRFT